MTSYTDKMQMELKGLARRESHKARLRRLLSDGRWHSMVECQQAGGWRYGGRIHELRKEGLVIDTRQDAEGVFSYRWWCSAETGEKP